MKGYIADPGKGETGEKRKSGDLRMVSFRRIPQKPIKLKKLVGKQFVTRLQQDGGTQLPKAIRKALRFEKGDFVVWTYDGSAVTVNRLRMGPTP